MGLSGKGQGIYRAKQGERPECLRIKMAQPSFEDVMVLLRDFNVTGKLAFGGKFDFNIFAKFFYE